MCQFQCISNSIEINETIFNFLYVLKPCLSGTGLSEIPDFPEGYLKEIFSILARKTVLLVSTTFSNIIIM